MKQSKYLIHGNYSAYICINQTYFKPLLLGNVGQMGEGEGKSVKLEIRKEQKKRNEKQASVTSDHS